MDPSWVDRVERPRSLHAITQRTLQSHEVGPILDTNRACFKKNSSLHILAEKFSTTFLGFYPKFLILSLKNILMTFFIYFFSRRLFGGFYPLENTSFHLSKILTTFFSRQPPFIDFYIGYAL